MFFSSTYCCNSSARSFSLPSLPTSPIDTLIYHLEWCWQCFNMSNDHTPQHMIKKNCTCSITLHVLVWSKSLQHFFIVLFPKLFVATHLKKTNVRKSVDDVFTFHLLIAYWWVVFFNRDLHCISWLMHWCFIFNAGVFFVERVL